MAASTATYKELEHFDDACSQDDEGAGCRRLGSKWPEYRRPIDDDLDLWTPSLTSVPSTTNTMSITGIRGWLLNRVG